MAEKLNKWAVARHPSIDTVLLAFGVDMDEIPKYGFSIKPEDAIEIGKDLIAMGQQVLETTADDR